MKERIEWIDHARAFAIFCMVFGHIEVFTMGHYHGFFHRLQGLFCMPLLFFLSGLVAKPQYSFSDSCQCIKKKFFQLIVPFFCCGSLYVFLCCPDCPWWFLFWCPKGEAHMGYWFLLVLFEVYLLFSMVKLLTLKLLHGSQNGRGFVFVSFAVWMLLLIALVAGHFDVYPKEPLWTAISFHRIYNNFPFFILGYWLMRHREKMEGVFKAKIFTAVSTLFIPLYVLRDRYEVDNLPFNWIVISLAVYSIIYLFYRHSDVLYGSLRRGLSYVGKHTLEIYVLHYFFLPIGMTWLNDLIAPQGIADHILILELILCTSLALAVICVTLMCAWIIRKNELLARIILGKIKEAKTSIASK